MKWLLNLTLLAAIVPAITLGSPDIVDPCSADITDQVSIVLGPLTQNPTTFFYFQTATVTNTGPGAIEGPLSLVLNFLPSAMTLRNQSGSTACFGPRGYPYVDLSLPDNRLAPGKSAEAVLQFDNPDDAKVRFAPAIAGPGPR